MKKQFTDQLSKLRLAIILPLVALAPAASIISAAPASADANNFTYVGQKEAHSASCTTVDVGPITVSAGDLVVSIDSAKSSTVPGLPSDNQSNTYTAYTTASAGNLTARSTKTSWAIASTSGSLTVTEPCSTTSNSQIVVYTPASGTTVTADSLAQSGTSYGVSWVGQGISSAASNSELIIGVEFGTNSPATAITTQDAFAQYNCPVTAYSSAPMNNYPTSGGVGSGEMMVSSSSPNGFATQTTTSGTTAAVCFRFQNYVNGQWVDATQPAVTTILGFTAS